MIFNTVEIKVVKEEIGILVKLLRKRENISQEKLADKLDVSRITIQNIESGKNFTIDTLFKILKEFEALDDIYAQLKEYNEDLKNVKPLY